MKKSIVILLAAAGVLMSCAKEVSEPIPSSTKEEASESPCFRIPVRMERTVTKGSDDEFEFCFEDDTKVNISSSTGAATWTAGDQIALCESNGVNSKYLIANVDESTNEVSVTIDDDYSRANYAIYPASAAGTNYTTPTVVYADSYDMDGVTNMETFSMAPMVAVNSGDLDFYHVGGLVRLAIKGVDEGVQKIRVTFNGMTYVTGTYNVSNAGTASAYTTLSSGSHNYVDFTKTSDFYGTTILNIPVPSGDYSSCTGLSIGLYDSSSSLIDTYNVSIPWISVGRGKGKKESCIVGVIDLSRIHPLTRSGMLRETANCYIVTEPGYYKIPLFYGNSIVDGADNLSTAAPAKGGVANKGVFVNAYDVAISSGNIKTDLEAAGQTLNTSGGKLIWSTANSLNSALVTVDADIVMKNGVAFLSFEVPSSGFREGSALIGVLKSGSTTEYVWAWHIWITDGSVLATDAYTNNQSQTIDMLNRPLGGREGTSCVSTYYQYGMPFPLPPSDGTGNYNAPLYDENGTYTFNYDSDNTITTLGKALSKPYLPRWKNGFYNTAAGATQNFYNIWDATQTSYNNDKSVVKTIYDPSPAGMSVPRLNAFTGFTTTGQNVNSGAPTNCNVVGSFSQGWKFKKNSSDATGSLWAASGYRYSGSAPAYVGSSGLCWSACPYSSTYGYYLYFGSSYVLPLYSSGRYCGFPVRPALLQI